MVLPLRARSWSLFLVFASTMRKRERLQLSYQQHTYNDSAFNSILVVLIRRTPTFVRRESQYYLKWNSNYTFLQTKLLFIRHGSQCIPALFLIRVFHLGYLFFTPLLFLNYFFTWSACHHVNYYSTHSPSYATGRRTSRPVIDFLIKILKYLILMMYIKVILWHKSLHKGKFCSLINR